MALGPSYYRIATTAIVFPMNYEKDKTSLAAHGYGVAYSRGHNHSFPYWVIQKGSANQ